MHTNLIDIINIFDQLSHVFFDTYVTFSADLYGCVARPQFQSKSRDIFSEQISLVRSSLDLFFEFSFRIKERSQTPRNSLESKVQESSIREKYFIYFSYAIKACKFESRMKNEEFTVYYPALNEIFAAILDYLKTYSSEKTQTNYNFRSAPIRPSFSQPK